MRDGVKLAVDFYSVNQGKYPAILKITPYGRKLEVEYRPEAEYWFSQGYVFVIADSRGSGDSEGEFEFFANEGEDGYDLIEWISKQSWCNSQIAMIGHSYSGTNQWFIAAQQPPSLKCITPSATYGRPLEHPPYENALSIEWCLYWIGKIAKLKNNSMSWVNEDPSVWLKYKPLNTLDEFATGRVLPLFRKFLQHPTLDSFWEKIIIKPEEYSKINVPSLAFTGWYDGTLYGTVMRFREASLYSPNKNDHFIVIGPYMHNNAADGGYDFKTGKPAAKIGDIILDENVHLPGLNMTREFFDWCLKNKTRPNWDKSRLYITGSNKWVHGSFLIQDNYEDLYLYLSSLEGANSFSGDGKLSFDEPDFGKDSFDYDPNEPVRSDVDSRIFEPIDLNFYLNRSDFLVFTSDAIEKPITILGQVNLELTFSSNVRDTDFVAYLMDVQPDGRSIKLSSMGANQMRTRYREGFDKEVLLEKDKMYNLTIKMHEMGHTFQPGHRVRLAITSSFYPYISANPNTGNPIESDTSPPVKSTQTIYYGGPLMA
ncbi:hydrolase [Brachionus plicatilis]|uniref:Hydrolase n=1 Tax=Brachionus plicatilis TaxID=10195 RepID=A0A3M7RFS3_BRAPC|nr:hydrolase [Brachionus plicatilis]